MHIASSNPSTSAMADSDYATDLLCSVRPLIFAVDSILRPDPAEAGGGTDGGGGSTSDHFDRFLEAIVGDDGGGIGGDGAAALAPHPPPPPPPPPPLLAGSISAVKGSAKAAKQSKPKSIKARLTKKLHLSKSGSGGGGGNSLASIATFGDENASPEAFFRRANVVPVSSRHAFPPSRDPYGARTRARTTRRADVESIIADGVDGILPTGWLEKHLHALPSVLVVVTTIDAKGLSKPTPSLMQDRRDAHTAETVEAVRSSLAPKRACAVRLVCVLVGDETADASGAVAERVGSLSERCGINPASDVSVLREADYLATGSAAVLEAAPSPAPPPGPLAALRQSVQAASLRYYSAQSKTASDKLGALASDVTTMMPVLRPLAARYCLKVAVFSELAGLADHSAYLGEAYWHVEALYGQVCGALMGDDREQRGGGNDRTRSEADISMAKGDPFAPSVPDEDDFDDEHFEVNIQDPPTVPPPLDGETVSSMPPPPTLSPLGAIADPSSKEAAAVDLGDIDLVHQCRTIAEALNAKLLAFYLVPQPVNLAGAAAQWRRHLRAFLQQAPTVKDGGTQAFNVIPPWNHASYVARQLARVATLMEQCTPAPPAPGTSFEAATICCPWAAHASAAEALVRLGAFMHRSRLEMHADADAMHDAVVLGPLAEGSKPNTTSRQRYVGAAALEAFEAEFEFESARDHLTLALDLVTKAIKLHENKVRDRVSVQGSDGDKYSKPKRRSLAQLHYLAGSVLAAHDRLDEAVQSIESALLLSEGWTKLETQILRAKASCLERLSHANASESHSTGKDANLAIVLDQEMAQTLSADELKSSVAKAFSGPSTTPKAVSWHAENSSSAPMDFIVTFPNTTQATTGDLVPAVLAVQSNLGFAVELYSGTLHTSIGEVPLSLSGPVMIEPGSAHRWDVMIPLPLQMDIVDQTKGKGKIKPTTAGMTRAAGSCYSLDSMSELKKKIGGTPVNCREFEMGLRSSAIEGGRSILLTLFSRRRASRTDVQKKALIEEENYVMSSWARPRFHAFSLGPRCIRVHEPSPDISITDMTGIHTRRRLMEGTINRILIKVQAGKNEICHSLRFSVTCSSTLAVAEETADGPIPVKAAGGVSDNVSPLKRLPMLVEKDSSIITPIVTEEGYTLPAGWKPKPNSGLGKDGLAAASPVSSVLNAGKSTFLSFDIFRPMPLLPKVGGNPIDGDPSCWSRYTIRLSYKQGRPDRRPDVQAIGDSVTREFSGSVLWCPPLNSHFNVVKGVQKTYPSGIRHPSNRFEENVSVMEGDDDAVAIDGEDMRMRCALQADEAKYGLAVEVQKVSFESPDNKNCEISIISDKASSNLFSKNDRDESHSLRTGSILGMCYNIRTQLNSSFHNPETSEERESIRAPLGVLVVDWLPVGLAAIEGNNHGPLLLPKASTIKFFGPMCCIERAPFEARLLSFPAAPRVAVPFKVKYLILNKTCLHQRLSLSITEPHLGGKSEASDALLISGFVNGDVHLAPSESRVLCYSALAMMAGRTPMPNLTLFSLRYKSWVINDGPDSSRHLFVLP